MGQCLAKEQIGVPKIVELDDTQVGMARGFTFQKLGLIQRRYEQICGSITGGMDVHRFSKLFAHLPYTSERIERLFSMFNIARRSTLTFEEVVEGLRVLCHGSEASLARILFYLYGDFVLGKMVVLQSELEQFMECHKSAIKNLSNSSQMQETAATAPQDLIQRAQLPSELDLEQFIDWIFENYSLKSIHLSFLHHHIEALEKQLWEEYISMDLFQKKVCLISSKWWSDFKHYISTKYKITFMEELNRRSSWDGTYSKTYRRMTTDVKTNNIAARFVADKNGSTSFAIEENGRRFIDNHDLSGVFEGELRRELSNSVDFVMVSPSMYDRLHLLYGGGPRYERSIVRGNLELYPLFLRQLVYDGQTIVDSSYMLSVYSRSSAFSHITKRYHNDSVFYFRGIGQAWKKLPNDEEKLLYEMDIQSNGFLVGVRCADELEFLKRYCPSRESISNPIYGDIFVLKTHPKKREVCVLRVNKYELTLHNLGMEGRKLYSCAISDLHDVLEIPDGDKNRTEQACRKGLINLGNCSYINASLTLLFYQPLVEEPMRRLSNADLSNSTYKLIMQLNNESQTGNVANPRKLIMHLNSQLKDRSLWNEQRRPAEFLDELISRLKQEQQRFVNSPRLLHSLLMGRVVQSAMCQYCNKETEERNWFNILNCSSDESSCSFHLEQLIRQTFQAPSSIACSNCNCMLLASTTIVPPVLLLLNLQNERHSNGPVLCPHNLMLQPSLVSQRTTYRLLGLICSQDSSFSPHYYSLLRHDNSWLLLNDQLVRHEPLNRLDHHHVCIAMYSIV